MSKDFYILSAKSVEPNEEIFEIFNMILEKEDHIKSDDITNFFAELLSKYPENEDEFNIDQSIWVPPDNEIYGSAAILYLNNSLPVSQVAEVIEMMLVLCKKYNLYFLDPQSGEIYFNGSKFENIKTKKTHLLRRLLYRSFIQIVVLLIVIFVMILLGIVLNPNT